MRKAQKEIRDRTVVEGLLRTCHVGRMATVGGDGYPMVKPLNFAYRDGSIYVHSASEGEKIADIRRDGRVCFEVDQPIAFLKARTQPCEAEYLYRSVIVKGIAHLITEDGERREALDLLMQKYQPEGGLGEFPPAKLALTAIIRIDIEEMTGKEDLGQGTLREAALKALREMPEPVRLERPQRA